MRARKIAAAVLFFLCIALAVLCSFPQIFPWDARLVNLLCGTLPAAASACFLLVVLWGGELRPPKGGFPRALLWSLPCFAVALANFPYSALASGSASIVRPDLLWLFLLKCISVALMEELFFRALLLPAVLRRLRGVRGGVCLSVLITAALFGAAHLFNLLFGAGLGATALQVGYTFLLGIMLGVMSCVTENVWLCVSVHALFDVGGLIVTDLGAGAFQDTVFWILTAVCGVLCAVHIVVSVCILGKRGRLSLIK